MVIMSVPSRGEREGESGWVGGLTIDARCMWTRHANSKVRGPVDDCLQR